MLFKNFDQFPNDKSHRYLTKTKYHSSIMETCPIKPRGGEGFLYKSESTRTEVSIPDQNNWLRSEKSTNLKGVVKIRYYINVEGKKNKNFTRVIYFLEEQLPQERIF